MYGPNTPCKRCSDYGLECKYEYALGEQPASPSPTPSLLSSPEYNPRNPAVRPDSGASRPYRAGADSSCTTSQGFRAPSDTSFISPSHSGNLQPPFARAGASPLANAYGVLHQGNTYPDLGTNSHPSQGFNGPFATTGRTAGSYIGNPYDTPQFNPIPGQSNSFGALSDSHRGQGPVGLAQQMSPGKYVQP